MSGIIANPTNALQRRIAAMHNGTALRGTDYLCQCILDTIARGRHPRFGIDPQGKPVIDMDNCWVHLDVFEAYISE
ncbi:MAG: hypothetical protein RBJ76_13370 [Stenomitos frigidus ULC029]